MTNTWQDIKNADVVLCMGGNAAEAHPCGFKWVIEAKIENHAKLVVVDPRFTRTASVADDYAPIRPGTDIAFLSGVIRYLLEKDAIQHEYVRAYHQRQPDREGRLRASRTGCSTATTNRRASYDKSNWDYELDAEGYAKVDDSWQHPRCVINLLRKHVERYTPEMVSRICGTPQDKYLQICELIADDGDARQGHDLPVRARLDAAFGRLAEHPHHGDGPAPAGQYRRQPGGGMNALRGHSNIQGLTDLGLLSNQMPGYLGLPIDAEPTLEDYMKTRQFKPLRPGQTSYYQNYRKFLVSFQKAIYGDAASADNNWAYDWLPKLDIPLRHHPRLRDDGEGRDERLHLPGLQPAAGVSRQGQDPRRAGQAEIPRHDGSAGHRDLALLAGLRAAESVRSGRRPDRSLPAADDLLRRRERLAGQLGALAAVALEGRRRAGRSPAPTSGSCRASSIGCARCTARKAAPSPTRS